MASYYIFTGLLSLIPIGIQRIKGTYKWYLAGLIILSLRGFIATLMVFGQEDVKSLVTLH